MNEEKKVKRCPRCGSKSPREIPSLRTGELVGYQCERKRCLHWWIPRGRV